MINISNVFPLKSFGWIYQPIPPTPVLPFVAELHWKKKRNTVKIVIIAAIFGTLKIKRNNSLFSPFFIFFNISGIAQTTANIKNPMNGNGAYGSTHKPRKAKTSIRLSCKNNGMAIHGTIVWLNTHSNKALFGVYWYPVTASGQPNPPPNMP